MDWISEFRTLTLAEFAFLAWLFMTGSQMVSRPCGGGAASSEVGEPVQKETGIPEGILTPPLHRRRDDADEKIPPGGGCPPSAFPSRQTRPRSVSAPSAYVVLQGLQGDFSSKAMVPVLAVPPFAECGNSSLFGRIGISATPPINDEVRCLYSAGEAIHYRSKRRRKAQ